MGRKRGSTPAGMMLMRFPGTFSNSIRSRLVLNESARMRSERAMERGTAVVR